MPLSAEAQHVVDSLEAHLVAVKAAADGSAPQLAAHAKQFGEDALAALEAFGATIRGAVDAGVADVEAAAKSAFSGKTFGGPTGNSSIPAAAGVVGGIMLSAGAPEKSTAADVGSSTGEGSDSLG